MNIQILINHGVEAVNSACDGTWLQDFAPLNVGWAKGMIQYGTGLMIQPLATCPFPIG